LATLTGTLERAIRWCQRRPALAGLIATVVVMSGLGVATVTWSWLQTKKALADIEAAQRDRALSQVDALLTAEPESVPLLIQNLAPFRKITIPRLQELSKGTDLSNKQRIRVSLALLPVDEGQIDFLTERLLDSQPDEVIIIRNALQPHWSALEEKLWLSLEDSRGDSARRLRAACALAEYVPGSPRWEGVLHGVADRLVQENPILLGKWTEALRPIRNRLVNPLVEIFRGSERPESERTLATSLLGDYAGDMPGVIADVTMDSDPKQFKELLASLRLHPESAVARLKSELTRTLQPEWKDETLDTFATPDSLSLSKIEKAHGLIGERFALCQTIPLDEFIAVAEDLRQAGYRPVRVRPYTIRDTVQVAAVWTGDDHDWQIVHHMSADAIQRHDADLQKQGYYPVDVGGYIGLERGRDGVTYIAVWRKSGSSGSQSRMQLEMTDSQLMDSQESLKKSGYVLATLNTVLGPDGKSLHSAIWETSNGGSEPIAPLIGDEASYERRVGAGLQVDVSVSKASNADPKASPSPLLNRAEEVLRLNPDDPAGRMERGQALLVMGKNEPALADFSFVIENTPKDPAPYQCRAVAHARLGQFTQAEQDLTEAHRLIDPMKVRDYLSGAARVFALAAGASAAANKDTAKANAERAIGHLKEAIVHGYNEYKQLHEDPDLDAIRSEPDFQDLMPLSREEVQYSGIWRASDTMESQEFHGLTPSQCVQRCRSLATHGYRPAAIAVASFDESEALFTASVWHRPVAQLVDRTALAKRQAKAAIALIHLNRPDLAWTLLGISRDPTVRTELIHLCGHLGVDSQLLMGQLETERDVSTRRALILALGHQPNDLWSDTQKQAVAAEMLRRYRDDSDPGIHSAAEWLLRRWGNQSELKKLDDELVQLGLQPGGKWYVNRQGHTMAIIDGPIQFTRGSPTYERGRWWNEVLHNKRIRRSFAIATKEVSVSQFEGFMRNHSEVPHFEDNQRYSPDPGGPAIRVSWYAAAAYCRWLSEEEGLPDDQMCFPPVAEIKEGMVLPQDYLQRTGYRMPTDAEWEYACRAGAETIRFFGVNEAMISQYAWYQGNAKNRTHPVGTLKPNDFGLFDMHGNVVEWCLDPGVLYEPGAGGWSHEDNEFKSPVSSKSMRVLRGGAFDDPPEDLRAAKRNGFLPTYRFEYNGLRVARTLQ
jgi:hypothetical protein